MSLRTSGLEQLLNRAERFALTGTNSANPIAGGFDLMRIGSVV